MEERGTLTKSHTHKWLMTSRERLWHGGADVVFARLGGLEWASNFSMKELSSPECADHLVLSMCGSTSKSCLEAKGLLSSHALNYGKLSQACN